MALVDADKLLRHEQGLGNRDYDLHHYDLEGGFLTLANDPHKNSKDSHVAVRHFWASEGTRADLMKQLCTFAERMKGSQSLSPVDVHSCAVLKECMDVSMVTLWIRMRTRDAFTALQSSEPFKKIMLDIKPIVRKTELHQSRAFNGHIDQKPGY